MPTPKIQFGMNIPGRRVEEFSEWLRLADEIDLGLIGVGDTPIQKHDVYVELALAAQHTKRAKLGPWVTMPIVRHPIIAASSIATIQEMSEGRAFFALGPGDVTIYDIGEAGAKMGDVAEYALAVKGLCAGEVVEYQGKELKLSWPQLPAPVPVWLAGDGPRNLEMAGRIADGVIVGNAATVPLVEWAQYHVRVGAEEAGRDPSQIDMWYMARVAPARTVQEGIDSLAFYLASYANVRFRHNMFDKGVDVDEDTAERIRGFRSEYRGDLSHRHELDHNVKLLKKYGLVQWLADQFLITGPPELCIERLRDLIDAGATNFYVPLLLPDPMGKTRELAKEVFAAFR
jgi:5,10-methylenetetrahydromethanopterin reductase